MMKTDRDLAWVSRSFHALSDPTRLRVVEMLSAGERCVCELQEALGVAQSRLSFHLKVLREAGLASDRKQGRWNYYSLRPAALEEMATYLEERKPEEGTWASCADRQGVQGRCCD